MSSGAESYIAIFPADPNDPTSIPGLPAGPGEQINFTDESLGSGITTEKSDHIRPDRMTQNITVIGKEIAGDINSELHFEADTGDKLLAAALWGEWEALFDNGDKIVSAEGAVLSGTNINLSGLASTPDNLSPGVGFRLQATGSNNNGFYTIVGNAGVDSYTVAPGFLTDETLPAGSSIDSEFVKNASIPSPFFIERGHIDVSEYFQFMGMYVDGLSQDYPEQGMASSSYSLLGMDSDVVQAPTYTDYSAPTTNGAFSTSRHIPSIRIDGVETDDCLVQSFSLEVVNNSSPKTGVGVFGACGITPHRFEATGSLTMYFNDATMYDRLISGTEFEFGWTLQDSLGNAYLYNMQRCQLSENTVNVTGIDDDVMDTASYEALADPESEAAIIISRFPAGLTL